MGYPFGTPSKDTMAGIIEAEAVCDSSLFSRTTKGESLQGPDGSSASRSKLVGEVGYAREARSTGSHCGGHATGCSASASLLATLGLVMCGMTAA